MDGVNISSIDRLVYNFSVDDDELAKATPKVSANGAIPSLPPPPDGQSSDAKANKGRPLILLKKGEVHLAVDGSIAALANAETGVFARGESIVRPVVHHTPSETISIRSNAEGNLARADGSVVIGRLEADALVELLTRHADFQKFDGRAKDWVATDCPADIARMVLARRGHGWTFPQLRAIIQAPTLRPDGSVLSEAGYDGKSGLMLVSDRQWPLVPSSPSLAEARKSLAALRLPLSGFPFVAPTDEAAALALLITALVRPILKTAPMFAVSAPSAGTGKSKMIDIAAVLATGRAAAVVTPTSDEAELEKRIGAAALAGDAIINLDNVSSVLRSDQLCQMITQPEVLVRVLGTSQNVKIPNTALIAATGNNLALYGDLNRRTVRIRLDAGVERPDERDFKFDPVEYAKKHRLALVAAALTILRSYIVAGSPKPAPVFGSFEDWSDLVRSALLWLGTDDPRGDTDDMRAEDPEKLALGEVLDALPTWPFTVKDVKHSFTTNNDVRAALSRFVDRAGGFNGTSFAGYLRRYKGTPVGGKKITLVKADEKHGAVWSVSSV